MNETPFLRHLASAASTRRRPSLGLVALLLISLVLAGHALAAPQVDEDKDPLRYRVRLTKMTPSQPAMIHWTYGGHGLGGDPVSDVVTRELPAAPSVDEDAADALLAELDGPPRDRVIVHDGTWDVHYLNPGVWSRSRPLRELRSSMMTMLATGHRTGTQMTDCEMEFEVSYKGKIVKTFTIVGQDRAIFGVIIPWRDLSDDGQPTPAFIRNLGSLLSHAQLKQQLLQQEPWFNRPTPRLTSVISDCNGRSRTADMDTVLAEVEVMRLMGMNGFRGIDTEIADLIRNREGVGVHFTRSRLGGAGGSFPIPMIDRGDGRAPFRHKGDGCPYDPANTAGIASIVTNGTQRLAESASAAGVEAFWGLTTDEIGNVYGGSNEGGNHPGACPYCSEAFRDMVKDDGRTLADFGASSWDEIRPVQGYWAINYWDSHRILSERVAAAAKALEEATKSPLGLDADAVDIELEEKEPVDYSALLVQARERLKQLEWNSAILFVPEAERKISMHKQGWQLLEYYSRQFMGHTSASLFHPQKVAVQALRQKRRDAIASGNLDSPDARLPEIYTYGLRQPTFTWGGSSIGWFDYYRLADTAMVYETSNRDGRVWQWDSYLNDVGYSLQRFCGVDFGVYVKPHRGAPVQRALSAAMRGSKLLYWYTYGPEWSKGDSFGGSPELRSKVAMANRLIAASEDVLVGGDWAVPAQVAIVRPRTAEYFSGSNSWENGKWNYMALAHAHIPVTPLDEILIETADLSNYKVIVVSGSHLRRKSAQRLRQWVADGGTLYTNGFGMAKDEAGQPLELLYEVFGVTGRQDEFTTWGTTSRYGATRLASISPVAGQTPPADAQVTATDLLEGSHQPAVGLEILQPAATATVLATNASGQPVALRHSFGKGTAYLVGTFAGLEYANDVMQRQPYDAAKRSWIAGPVLAAGVEPVVKASEPLVEGGLIENPSNGKLALGLLYWATTRDAAPLENVTVTFRGFGSRRTVRSVVLERELPATIDGPWMTVTLPTLSDADVLIIE